ncbi:MAG: histone deacetylase [Nibricoccus sp.]
MIIFHDPQCADYGATAQYEKPARVATTVARLRAAHFDWQWRLPPVADEEVIKLVHSPQHLERLQYPHDFDQDTPFFEGIYQHARRSVGSALAAMDVVLNEKKRAFSLMRPPGHHALPSQAMGFCYLNQVAIAVLAARQRGLGRVAVWDFDAHHGNGTEDILHDREGVLFVDVHQDKTYPGTGAISSGNCRNYCVAPHAPREEHLAALRRSLNEIQAFKPDLLFVSAGFDAYAKDPITEMSLLPEDYAQLGRWLTETQIPAVGILEGGYSEDLPILIDSFLTAWAE